MPHELHEALDSPPPTHAIPGANATDMRARADAGWGGRRSAMQGGGAEEAAWCMRCELATGDDSSTSISGGEAERPARLYSLKKKEEERSA